jgi:hypothetical protein
MDHQFLNLIIVPLAWQPKCELTPNEHFTYIRFLWWILVAEILCALLAADILTPMLILTMASILI